MSDIDTYLAQLRSHLTDLDPKRADEIVAEARTHLESRTAQLRATGVGEDEAMGEALAAFGDPARMAKDLVDKNSRHRRPARRRRDCHRTWRWVRSGPTPQHPGLLEEPLPSLHR